MDVSSGIPRHVSVRIVSKDNGYEKMRELLKAASKGAGVSVGVHAAEGAEQHGNAAARITTDSGGRHHLDGKFISKGKADALRAKANQQSSVTVLDIATFHEFGLGVPERPWLRAWYDQSGAENQERLRTAMKLVIKGSKTLEEALELVGLKMAGELQQAIASQSLGLQADSPETVKQKGSSTPLIDKGQFRQSITHLVRGSSKLSGV
jgi:hypothetical protein